MWVTTQCDVLFKPCVWGMSYILVVTIPKVYDSFCLVAQVELEKKQLKTAGPWSRFDINKWEKMSRAGSARHIVHAIPVCAVPSFFISYRDSPPSLESNLHAQLGFLWKGHRQRSSALKQEWIFRITSYFTGVRSSLRNGTQELNICSRCWINNRTSLLSLPAAQNVSSYIWHRNVCVFVAYMALGLCLHPKSPASPLTSCLPVIKSLRASLQSSSQHARHQDVSLQFSPGSSGFFAQI